tara:strand:- start:3125 stop:3349 length:225 start_codon:yes stop_codon:yes gene_type:complete
MPKTKTQQVMNRIVQVINFQNMACCCSNWQEFTQELEEWGVTGCAKIEFDDPDLNVFMLDQFIKAENGYIREVA